jgi:hypothetical protein
LFAAAWKTPPKKPGREGARHAQRPDKVHFKLLSRGLDRPIGEKAAGPSDAGIVDKQVDVPGYTRRGSPVSAARRPLG